MQSQCRYEILLTIIITSRVLIEGKSSVCVICMKYWIIILSIIIISLGQISLSYIANTSRMHANIRAHAHTNPPPSPFRLSLFDGSGGGGAPNHDGVNTPFRRFRWRSMAGRCFIYTIILRLSVAVNKRQVAIIARSSREISQTVRID